MNEKYLDKIRDLREGKQLTQHELAKILGTSQTMYSRYERGVNELPIHLLRDICQLYDVSADYILDLPPKEHTELSSVAKSQREQINQGTEGASVAEFV